MAEVPREIYLAALRDRRRRGRPGKLLQHESADEQTEQIVARRLGRSTRWLQERIRDKPFHHHHYVGRSPRWDETEFQALRRALQEADRAKAFERQGRKGSKSKSAADIGTPPAPFGRKDSLAASERVQNFRRQMTHGTTPTSSPVNGNARSATSSSMASSPPSPSRLHVINSSAGRGNAR